jgi:type IX secretion system PorP/SprF family membrane protein
MHRIKVTLIAILIFSANAFSQDPEFTQFYANPLYLNPAFAGSQKCPRLALNYRNQWPALSGNFVTYTASYDQFFDPIAGGVGILILNDQAGEGTLTTTNASLMYAYHLNVSREFSIKFGMQAMYVQKKVDWDKLRFGDQIDARYGFVYQTIEIRPETQKSFMDFSAGILMYTTRVYGGFAVNHLTEPDEKFFSYDESPLPRKYTAHAGALLPLSGEDDEDATYISPNILFQLQQDFQQLNFGVYVAKRPLVGGLWYRNRDSFIALVGLQQGIFKFGYSYDITVSKLRNASAGSHEFSLGLQFTCRPKTKRFRAIKCPAF